MTSPLQSLESAVLPEKYLEILHKNGFRYVVDVPQDAFTLSKSIPLDINECQLIVASLYKIPAKAAGVRGSLSYTRSVEGKQHSGTELLKKQSQKDHIVTFCQGFDKMMGGGIASGEVSELFGEPGIGKTQFCMQLCLAVQIPSQFGGLSGKAIYIDSEGSLHPQRLYELSKHVQNHLIRAAKRHSSSKSKNNNSSSSNSNILNAAQSFTPEHMLRHIERYRIYNGLQLLATVKHIVQLINKERCSDNNNNNNNFHKKSDEGGSSDIDCPTPAKQTRLIVIDSIAAPFRGLPLNQMKQRNSLLANTMMSLRTLARISNVAIVVINQVTTKIDKSGADVVGALGVTWQHHASNRVHLKFRGTTRVANLVKSAYLSNASAPYRVTSAGIRDVKTGEKRPRSS